jgi:hypothetical protein
MYMKKKRYVDLIGKRQGKELIQLKYHYYNV